MTPRPYSPREYQPLGTDHISEHRRCALWAGMGMGKGVMALTALSQLELTEEVWPALAIGPLRVARDVWTREPQKWDHLAHIHTSAVIGDEDARRRALKVEAPLYSINYENLEWLIEYVGTDRWPFRTIIADESRKLQGYRGSYRTHPKSGKVFLQGAGGTRARALAKVAHERTSRFIELTGRPAPNGLTDLWAQAWFLDRGERLGRTYEGFVRRWFRPKYDGYGVEPLQGAEAEIHARLKDVCLTLDPKDWFDLREPIVNDVYVELPPAARKLYREMEKDLFIQLEGATVEAFGAAAKSQKCLQLANGAVYIDPEAADDRDPRAKKWKAVHDAKIEALESVISEHDGSPMMIVYSFRSDLARIKKLLPKAIDLSEQANELAFKRGGIDYGICHPDSLGHGVDGMQQVCYTITHFGHGWSLDSYDQINERIGPVRQIQAGFDRAVRINHILARDTLDEDVMERRVSKRSVQDILLAAMNRRRR
ncbi:MAG: DEAD/DEAH box helicase [Deltaproteobacteria bacterium]|nr:DEAD/DEAH box helicase [Deltaproteobacteria bacterium]